MKLQTHQRLKYIISDTVACNVAWCVFNIIRYYTLPDNYSQMSLQTYYSMRIVLLGQIVFPMMLVCMYALFGFYNECTDKSRVDQVVNSFGVSFIGAIAIFFIALFNDSIDDRLQNYEMVTILWLLISVFVAVPRMIITQRFINKIVSGEITFKTLIVGTSEKARHISYQLTNKYARMGLSVAGFVNVGDVTEHEIDGKPVYRFDDIHESIDDLGVSSFIVVHDGENVKSVVDVINTLFPTGKSIYITPDILHFITMRPKTSMVSGELLIDVSRSSVSQSTMNIKRISDIVISSIALLALVPVFIVVAFLVKRSSPGPVLYSQQRVGLKKKLFNIYKFRTMYVDIEANGPSLSSDQDQRVTPVGRVLRKYRIDELPQFWNVLKGEMSIVGPRPEREYYLRQIIDKAPYYSLLHQVRPGITSWGMVKYGYATSVDQMIERAKFDLLYVDNVSFIVDMKILLYTIETVITGKGI